MAKNALGKIVKTVEIGTVTMPKPKTKHDPFHNNAGVGVLKNAKVYQPAPPTTNDSKLLWQAIYYVANDRPKDARKCLLAISPQGNWHMNSWQAKCWVKEEAAIQRRHPQERERYDGKPMPEEFRLLEFESIEFADGILL